MKNLVFDVLNSNDSEEPLTSSTHGYPPRFRPRPLEHQIQILQTYWPNADLSKLMHKFSVPSETEMLCAVLDWRSLTQTGTYQEVLEAEILPTLKILYGKNHFFSPPLGCNKIRRKTITDDQLKKLKSQQGNGNILIIPAQLGMLHRGWCPRAVSKKLAAYEFGLGAFEVGCILLTHPERLSNIGCLNLSCIGDESCPAHSESFWDFVPEYFYFNGNVFLGCPHVGSIGFDEQEGVVTGFLPIENNYLINRPHEINIDKNLQTSQPKLLVS